MPTAPGALRIVWGASKGIPEDPRDPAPPLRGRDTVIRGRLCQGSRVLAAPGAAEGWRLAGAGGGVVRGGRQPGMASERPTSCQGR